jgi:phthalate 4,5-cis-dihydrodiol dehydrogenase
MNVGIIGAGFFGAKHAEAITRHDDVRLVAVCRSSADAVAAFAERHGGTPYTRYQDLLADPRVDAVVIATPHATHEEIAVAAARAGKHVLLEKPMAPTAAACERIIAAFDAAGSALVVGHLTRFSRAYRLAKAMLDAGELGEIVTGISTMRKRWHEPNRRAWHLDRQQGGGVLLTAGIHALDRLTWLVSAPVSSVSAQIDVRFHDQDADDTAVLFLRYAGGVTGVVMSLGYADGAPQHDTVLTCTRGVLAIDAVAGVRVGRGEAFVPVPDSGGADWFDEALLAQLDAFLRATRGEESGAASAAFAHHVMDTIFSAELSAREGREVGVRGTKGAR